MIHEQADELVHNALPRNGSPAARAGLGPAQGGTASTDRADHCRALPRTGARELSGRRQDCRYNRRFANEAFDGQGYSPDDIETRIYDRWEAPAGLRPAGTAQPYCIMHAAAERDRHAAHGSRVPAHADGRADALPPHGRLAALWQPGTDHAGIATQMVVERQLDAEGKIAHDLGRETIRRARLGVEGAVRRHDHAPDAPARRLGRLVARPLHDGRGPVARGHAKFRAPARRGLIYRGKRLVNWDPVLHTALSDLEVQSRGRRRQLWHLRYPLAGRQRAHVVVATTRPETMLGDTAVAVHPGRRALPARSIGKRVELPLTGRRIPVIADDYVDPAFGTGCVKITPAHDFNDYEVGQRHSLPHDQHLHGRRARSTTTRRPRIAASTASRRASASSPISKPRACSRRSSRTSSTVPRGDRSGAVLEPC